MQKIYLASFLAFLVFLTPSPAGAQASSRGSSGRTGFGGQPGRHPGFSQGADRLSAPRAFSGERGFSGVVPQAVRSTGQFSGQAAPTGSFPAARSGFLPTHRNRTMPHFQAQVPGFSGFTTFVPPGLGFDSVHSALVHRGFPFPFPHHPSWGFGFNGFFSPCHRCFFGGPFVSHRFFFPFVPFFPTCTIFFTPGFINGSPFLFDNSVVVDDPPSSNVTGLDDMASTFVPGPQTGNGASPQPSRPHFVLVFKDHSIYGITAYRIADGRIHYATSYGAVNSVPLDLVDVDSTVQMNRERSLDFSIEPRPPDEP